MSVEYTVDEIVRASDDTVIRARFNAASLTALRVLAVFFALIAMPHLGEADNVLRGSLSVASLLLSVVTFFMVRPKARSRAAAFIRQNARAAAIAFAVAQAALLLTYNGSTASHSVAIIGTIIPCAVVLYRLLPAEHVLLHSSLAAMSTLTALLMPRGNNPLPELIIPAVFANIAALVAALLVSRRIRRRILGEWVERRASAREQVRMRDELRYARELQLSMLPESAPRLDWADISSISIPATEVGGDYFDYFVEDGRVALVCGDVAGHGMASGLVLSALRSGFILLRDSLHDPASVLQRLHDVVTNATRRRMLVTVSVILLDHRNGRVLLANAGHPPIILRRADGSVTPLNLYSPPLGVRLPVKIPQRQFELKPGDVFILHSDGIYETRNEADEYYGLDRLERLIRDTNGVDADGLRDAIVRDVTAFRGARDQYDDVTVVVCRITQ